MTADCSVLLVCLAVADFLQDDVLLDGAAITAPPPIGFGFLSLLPPQHMLADVGFLLDILDEWVYGRGSGIIY